VTSDMGGKGLCWVTVAAACRGLLPQVAAHIMAGNGKDSTLKHYPKSKYLTFNCSGSSAVPAA